MAHAVLLLQRRGLGAFPGARRTHENEAHLLGQRLGFRTMAQATFQIGDFSFQFSDLVLQTVDNFLCDRSHCESGGEENGNQMTAERTSNERKGGRKEAAKAKAGRKRQTEERKKKVNRFMPGGE